ncbi:nucleotidyltransferase domain-containing protein [Candidatus Woesearchaeota archaeon]|jgi:predicted nucleotidyltransferase|nr:nucleotidyltransferase domain-containing protein [Candidatus Woesearchaeota archaeon]
MMPENKIYLAYFKLKKTKLYYNQIKEYTGLSHSSLQNVLEKIIKLNIIKVEKTKSNIFYKIKNKKLFSLKFSEIAINLFEQLNLGVKSPLRNFLKIIPKDIFLVIIFGSASKKEEKKESDIDLLIVTDLKHNLDKYKKEAEITSKYPISIFQCSTKQFIENKDSVIIQARKTGFPIYKEQNFYEVLLDEY